MPLDPPITTAAAAAAAADARGSGASVAAADARGSGASVVGMVDPPSGRRPECASVLNVGRARV